MSRRHTNLADVPSGVSQIIIKLSFGNVKKETFYGRLGFPVRGSLLSAGGTESKQEGPRKIDACLPATLGTREEPPFCALFSSSYGKAVPAQLVSSPTRSFNEVINEGGLLF